MFVLPLLHWRERARSRTSHTHTQAHQIFIFPKNLFILIFLAKWSLYVWIHSPFTALSLSLAIKTTNDNNNNNNNRNTTPKIHRKRPTKIEKWEQNWERSRDWAWRSRLKKKKKWNKELPAILIQQHKYELKFLGTQTNYVSVYMPVRAAVHIRKTILTHLIFDWILCDVCEWFRVHMFILFLFSFVLRQF